MSTLAGFSAATSRETIFVISCLLFSTPYPSENGSILKGMDFLFRSKPSPLKSRSHLTREAKTFLSVASTTANLLPLQRYYSPQRKTRMVPEVCSRLKNSLLWDRRTASQYFSWPAFRMFCSLVYLFLCAYLKVSRTMYTYLNTLFSPVWDCTVWIWESSN